MWRWIIVIVLLVVVAAIVTAGLRSADTVEMAAAGRQPISRYVDERARTRLPRTWAVTMPVAGRILPIDLIEGDAVKAGQVIARVEIADLDTAVAMADARVRRLSASIVENNDDRLERTSLTELESIITSVDRVVEASATQTESSNAREEFNRVVLARKQAAFERSAASQIELDEAQLSTIESAVDYRTDVLSLRALEAIRQAAGLWPLRVRQTIEKKSLAEAVLAEELVEARAAHEQAVRDRRRSEILAPVDGVVLHRAVSSERVLAAGPLLLEIGRLEDLQVEVEVLSQDAVEIAVGDRVEITGAATGGLPCPGRVARVEPQGFTKISSLGVEQQRVRVIVDFEPGALESLAEAGRRLGADYRVRCRIFTETRDDTLVIPRAALFRGAGDRWQAFVVRGGRARLVDLQIGLINDTAVEVLSGLDDGDPVVLAPETDLADGTRVKER